MSRAANRAAFPEFAAAVDTVKRDCPDAKVLWVEEGGNAIGAKPADDGLVLISAEKVLALRAFYVRRGLVKA